MRIELHIEEKIGHLLEWLGAFGKDPGGGISRLLYTPEWLAAQKALEKLFLEAGLEVHYDAIGNLFGQLQGSRYKEETILTGSHIDTVKNGGLYDGQYGIIAGFLAIQYLQEKYGQPLRNLEVVSIAEEEGSRFPVSFWGSNNIVGQYSAEDVHNVRDFDGIPFVEAMHQAGFDFPPESQWVRSDLKAFIELHVEQGGVLERERKSVGIVRHIVGQRRYTIVVTGEANHAGTTPMKYRKDAGQAAFRMAQAVHELAVAHGEPLVATVGKINLQPNIANVVPGQAMFTLDVRHIDQGELEDFTDQALADMQQIARKVGVKIEIDQWVDTAPVAMDERLASVLKEQCEQSGISYKMMHSGAGHDAQVMAAHMPSTMLFVPSRRGISHSPHEYTDPKDLARGVQVLIRTLYHLAYKEEMLS